MCEHCKDEPYPCCWIGYCVANTKIGMCICCGAEMFEENGYWWHHEQKDIPIDERGMVHAFVSTK